MEAPRPAGPEESGRGRKPTVPAAAWGQAPQGRRRLLRPCGQLLAGIESPQRYGGTGDIISGPRRESPCPLRPGDRPKTKRYEKQ